MGAWDSGPFDNDTAMDLLRDLESGIMMEILAACVTLAESAYIDDDQGSRALAAAELIAAAKDGQIDFLQASALSVISKLPRPPPPDLIALARAAVGRVLQSSETRELRAELPNTKFRSWVAKTELLLKRLR
jgi:hypothetical protein